MRFKIGYFADGPWSHKAFKKLISDPRIEISFICVRYGTNDQTSKKFSEQFNIDYFENKNVNSKKFISIIKKYNCDLFVSMSFDQIFKSEIINISKHKIINCHAGKLPFYRGRNVLNWVLINDEKEFGITVHYVDKGIDTGDIILQKKFSISDQDNYKTLLKKSYIECANILYESILMFKNNNVMATKQKNIDAHGSYCIKRKLGDEILNWNQTSREIFNFVRGICKPGPSARAFINQREMKINKVEKLHHTLLNKNSSIGKILHKNSKSFIVKTQDSFLRVFEFEFDGEIKVGDRFEV